ncbi:MAG: SpoIID/LytB domain-containing protein [Cellulosilyticum sp.]|nr:SpoIID/LytB domain-containing protein [Cellulosilyticum sp.]
MKQYLQMFICIGSCFILLPILIIHLSGVEMGSKSMQSMVIGEQEVQEEQDIITEETLIGILAKEIPYTYEIESIKAQAVVARTYMARRILGIQKDGAIVGYTVDEMKALWGEEQFHEIYSIYQEAVQATRRQLIMYDNKPIEALYHEASSGRTRDAASIYKQDIPYLKSVESAVDKVTQQIQYSKKEIVERLKESYPSLVVETDTLESQIQIVKKDEADYITAIQIGNITLSGEVFKKILDLPSCAFKIYHSGEDIIFDVKGSGNGIGLSLNGANELAKQGMLYDGILHYYYTGITIENYEVQL